jgi:hypothetical protein
MAITAQDVAAYLEANPGLSDAQIASLANQYGVSSSLLSEATGVPIAQIEQRAVAAGTPITAGGTGMMTAAVPTTTTQQPTSAPITGNAGQYGYQNGAPVLNATVAKNLLGNEFDKKIDIGENNQLGWGTNSKYQGQILTGVGLYGVRGSSEEVQKILSAGDTFKQLQQQGKVITQTDPETGTVNYIVQSGIDQESGSPVYKRVENLFVTDTGEEGSSGFANFQKWQDYSAKLTDAAQKLGINPNQPLTNLLNEVNAKDTRIAVVGRTQYWDPAKTNGVGGQGGPQHAAVVYQQVGDKLVPASTVQTFDFKDPNTTRGFFGDIIGSVAEIVSIPPISMALSAFGAPYLATTLTSQFGLSDVAAKTIANGLIAGTTTGVITGDAEKALIATLLASGGTYVTNSGVAGDALDKIGLGEYKSTLGLLNTEQVNQVQDVTKTAEYLKSINGNDVAAIQRGLIDYGVDPALAASTANQVVSGIPTTQIAQDLAGFASQPQGLFTGGTGATGGLPTTATTTTPGTTPTTPAGATAAGATTAAAAGTTAGTAAGTTAGTVAGTAAGTTAGTVAGAAATGAAAGMLTNAAGNILSNLTSGNTLQNLLKTGIDFATASKIASDLEARAGQIQQQAVSAGQAAQVPFTPYTVTTGMGTSTLTPTGATMTATPAYQQLQQLALQQAQAATGAINPAQAAQTLYGQVEALAAPGRVREQETLLQGLQARGLTGFGQNLPTVGGQVRTVNPLFESLLSAQETARAQQALQSQQFGTQEAMRMQQLGAGLQTQAQNVDVQQLNQLLRAQGLSQDQINLALRNAEAQRLSTLSGLQYSTPLLTSAANIRSGQTANVGQAAQGMFGNLFASAVPSIYNNPANTGGFGTGYIFGNQDYGQYFG